MHLASEVTSTSGNQENSVGNQRNGSTSNGSVSDVSNQPLTAESLAERTIDSLMAEHPGELVRTGSPHIVSVAFLIY